MFRFQIERYLLVDNRRDAFPERHAIETLSSSTAVAPFDSDRGHSPKSIMSSRMSIGRSVHCVLSRICSNTRLCMCVSCIHGAEGKRHATEHEKHRARRGAAEA